MITPLANGVKVEFDQTAKNLWLNNAQARSDYAFIRFEIRTTNTRSGAALVATDWSEVMSGAGIPGNFQIGGAGYTIPGNALTPGTTYYLFAQAANANA